jgi:phosphatidylglycerol:prolipoprotein diacylglycerol transferase
VAEPLIPYITLPEIPLSFLKHVPLLGDVIDPRQPPSIKPFGTLVALGVYFGAVLAMRRAKERGHDAKAYSDFVLDRRRGLRHLAPPRRHLLPPGHGPA